MLFLGSLSLEIRVFRGQQILVFLFVAIRFFSRTIDFVFPFRAYSRFSRANKISSSAIEVFEAALKQPV